MNYRSPSSKRPLILNVLHVYISRASCKDYEYNKVPDKILFLLLKDGKWIFILLPGKQNELVKHIYVNFVDSEYRKIIASILISHVR